MSDARGSEAVTSQKIWDAPTRVLKWALAGLFATTWFYGWTLSFTTIGTHKWLAYGVAAVLALRLLWGLFGAPASRFTTMLRDLRDTPGYIGALLQRRPSHYPGHNPMGSLWLFAFWALLLAQIGTGLISYSDSFFDGGPLASMVSSEWSSWANKQHQDIAWLLLAMVGLHLTAVLFYAVWKRENLIWPMISGWKTVRRFRP